MIFRRRMQSKESSGYFFESLFWFNSSFTCELVGILIRTTLEKEVRSYSRIQSGIVSGGEEVGVRFIQSTRISRFKILSDGNIKWDGDYRNINLNRIKDMGNAFTMVNAEIKLGQEVISDKKNCSD